MKSKMLMWITIAGVATVFAQSPPSVVVSAGYTFAAPVNVAPGQVLTFFVQGIGRGITGPVRAPDGMDLPMSLAGISATLQQGANRAVPMLDIRPVSTCATVAVSSPCSGAALTAITVQIPYELLSYCGSSCGLGPVYALAPTYLWFSENGVAGAMIELVPFVSHVHVLTACDTIFANPAKLPWQQSNLNITLPCPPLVTHADGSLVSAQSPARAGEELVAYATGFGPADPPAPTGKIVGTALPARWPLVLDFNFRLDAGPSRPVYPPSYDEGVPVYAGLTPGFAGLYQVNFKVPRPPAGTTPCLPSVPSPVFQSNLTVSIGGYAVSQSFDGAGICVQP